MDYLYSLNGTLDAAYYESGKLTMTFDTTKPLTVCTSLKSAPAAGLTRRARVGYSDGTWLEWCNSNHTPREKGQIVQVEWTFARQGDGYETPTLDYAELNYSPLSIGVSAPVLNALEKLRNRRILGRVIIDYTDPFLDQSVFAFANEYATVHHVEQVHNNREDPTQKWLSLDGTWILDGTWYFPPSTAEDAILNEMGWWGRQYSDQAGSFRTRSGRVYGEGNPVYGQVGLVYDASVSRPTLYMSFSGRPVRNLKVIGDSKRGEYPTDFILRVFNTDGEQVYIEQVTDNRTIKWRKSLEDEPLPNVALLSVEILRWSHSDRCAKVIEFFTSVQETYEGRDLFQIHLLEEREVDNNSLPFGTISAAEVDLQLNNVEGRFDPGNMNSPLYGLVKPGRRIRPYLGAELPDGSVEWIPLGVFWSDDWHTPESEVYAETSGRDRLDMLRTTEYSTSVVISAPPPTGRNDNSTAQWAEGAHVHTKATNNSLILNISGVS